MTTQLRHGPGLLADPDAPAERWSGRKAQQWVQRTIAEYGDRCINCGLTGSDSADHVIPRSKGGAIYDLLNLGPSHRKCNYSRGNKPLTRPGIPVESGLRYFTGAEQ